MMTADEIWIDFKQGKLEAFYKNKITNCWYMLPGPWVLTMFLGRGLCTGCCLQSLLPASYFFGRTSLLCLFYTCIYHAAIDILRQYTL